MTLLKTVLVLSLVAVCGANLTLGRIQGAVMIALWLALVVGTIEGLPVRRPAAVTRVSLLIVGYGAFLVMATFVNGDGSRQVYMTLLAGPACALYLVLRGIRPPRHFVAVLMTAVAVGQAAVAWIQYLRPALFRSVTSPVAGAFAAASDFYLDMGRATGLWPTAVTLGTVLAGCLPFAIYLALTWRRAAWVCVAFIIGTIGLTGSRAPMGAALLILVAMLWTSTRHWSRRAVLLVLIAGVALLASTIPPFDAIVGRGLGVGSLTAEYTPSETIVNRGIVYTILTPHVFDSPILGIGSRFQSLLPSGWTSAHNSYLQSTLVFGIPATLLLALVLAALLQVTVACRRSRDIAFLCACVLTVFAVAFVGISHGVLMDFSTNMFVWLGVGLGFLEYNWLLRTREALNRPGFLGGSRA